MKEHQSVELLDDWTAGQMAALLVKMMEKRSVDKMAELRAVRMAH